MHSLLLLHENRPVETLLDVEMDVHSMTRCTQVCREAYLAAG